MDNITKLTIERCVNLMRLPDPSAIYCKEIFTEFLTKLLEETEAEITIVGGHVCIQKNDYVVQINDGFLIMSESNWVPISIETCLYNNKYHKPEETYYFHGKNSIMECIPLLKEFLLDGKLPDSHNITIEECKEFLLDRKLPDSHNVTIEECNNNTTDLLYEKKSSYIDLGVVKEPLILEPEDWTEDEWKTLLKVFGFESAEQIKVSKYELEGYGIPSKSLYHKL